MIEAAAQVLDFSSAFFWHGFAVFLRIGAAMSILPGFGEQNVPVRVRLGLAIAFTMIVAPSTSGFGVQDMTSIQFTLFAISETITGFALGVGVRMFIFALQTAGSMAAQSTSLAQIFGAAGVEPLPAIGHLLMMAGFALAMIMGLHVRLAQLLIMSYDILPAGEFIAASILSRWGVMLVASTFALAFKLAAPFVILSMLYNLTLGVINRAMPQLMVAFVGAPVITAGSLFLLFLVSPVLLSVWVGALNTFVANPFVVTP